MQPPMSYNHLIRIQEGGALCACSGPTDGSHEYEHHHACHVSGLDMITEFQRRLSVLFGFFWMIRRYKKNLFYAGQFLQYLSLVRAWSTHGCHSAIRGHTNSNIQPVKYIPGRLQLVAVSFYQLTQHYQLVVTVMDLPLLYEHVWYSCCPAEERRWTLEWFRYPCTTWATVVSGLCNMAHSCAFFFWI